MKKRKSNISLEDRMEEFRGLSYEELKERVLKKSAEDFKPEVIAKRINQVRREMRELRRVTTPTPEQLLTPFTI